MADYQKMYYILMNATEQALALLTRDCDNFEKICHEAAAELIDGELRCEEIYIQTSEDCALQNAERGQLTQR